MGHRSHRDSLNNAGASRGDDGSAAGGREDLENIAIAALEGKKSVTFLIALRYRSNRSCFILMHLGASSGANALIPFGTSSTILRANDAIQMGCCFSSPGSLSVDAEPKMPFLKKWVRTRHAILFRLSNRTVQVLFFDRRLVLKI
jgi:POLO box duplicated region